MTRAGAPKARPKSLLERRRELQTAATVLTGALNRFLAGEREQNVVLSGQLRSLLNRHGNKPLLLSVADNLGFALPCFGPCVDSESISATPLVDGERKMSSLPIRSFVSIRLNGLCDGETTFGAWIETAFFHDSSHPKKYTFGDMIFSHANQMGGAHYSDRVTLFEHSFSRVSMGGSPRLSLMDMLLVDASRVATHFATRVCEECDLRAYALLEDSLR